MGEVAQLQCQYREGRDTKGCGKEEGGDKMSQH